MRLLSLFVVALVCVGCPAKDPQMGELCTPGQDRCDANSYERCADDGARWVQVADCASTEQVCVVNRGCLNCAPGIKDCGGDDGFSIVLCREDGSQYDELEHCDYEIGDLCVGGKCENACANAEATRSYEGCDYWAVDLDNAVVSDQGAAAAQQYSIVVTNPLELPALVTVTVNNAPFGSPPNEVVVEQVLLARVVGGGDLAIIDLDAREVDCTSHPQLNDGSGSCLSSQAFHITSTAPIVAYQFNPLENVGVFSNDASLLLPTSAIDTDYLVMGWPQTLAITSDPNTNGTIDLRSFLTIVGTQPQTRVTVQLGLDVKAVLGATGIPAAGPGDLLQFDIGPYDVINLETDDFNADFTSTFIEADKPVAVFSGGEASDAPFFSSWLERDCCADHLEEQLFPISSFGTQFVAVKTPLRTKYVERGGWDVAVVEDEPEFWRILASDEDTSVTTNLPPPYNSFFLGRGQYFTFPSERDFVVQASAPISFAQIPGSQQTTGIPPVTSGGQRPPGGDPSLIMVPPVQQWRSKYVFLVPNKYAFDFMLIAVPSTTGVIYDGTPLDLILDRCEYEPIGTLMDGDGSTEYTAIRCPLSDPIFSDPTNPAFQDDGRHVVESDDGEPIGLIVWGWDSYVSYGYPAGTNLEQINPE